MVEGLFVEVPAVGVELPAEAVLICSAHCLQLLVSLEKAVGWGVDVVRHCVWSSKCKSGARVLLSPCSI